MLLSRNMTIAFMVVLAAGSALAQGSQSMITRPVLVTGKVVIDDGSPLPERAAIERVCSGQVQREVLTDTKGYFSFEVGREQPRQMQDATDHTMGSGIGVPGSGMSTVSPGPDSGSPTRSEIIERDLRLCELRASLRGFRSDSLSLAGRTFPDVGAIVLHRTGKAEGTMITATTAQAPKGAKKAFERARAALAKQNLQEGQQQLEEAVRIYPRFAEAWLNLGLIYDNAHRSADAQKAFEQALAADPKFIPPYFHLAVLATDAKQWERVVELTEKALALNAFDFPGLYFYNAAAYFHLHKLEQAETGARTARRLDSQYSFPVIDLLLGQILLERQDFGGAAEQLRSFLKHAPNAPEAGVIRAQLANLESKAPAKKP